MEGEDSGPAGGSRAVEGHVQNAVRGLNAVLLQGGEKLQILMFLQRGLIPLFFFHNRTKSLNIPQKINRFGENKWA